MSNDETPAPGPAGMVGGNQDKGKTRKGKVGTGKRKAPMRQSVSVPLQVVAGTDLDAGRDKAETGKPHRPEGLTSKQLMFCREVAKGRSLAESYRTAYDAGHMGGAAVRNEACRLMARPDIALVVDGLIAERERGASHDAARTRLLVLERLHAEASDPRNPPAARIRALELLGKVTSVSLFTERVETSAAPQDSASLAAELERRLSALMTGTDG